MENRVETADALAKKIKRWQQLQAVDPPESSSYRAWQRKIDAAQAKLNEMCPQEMAVAAYKADLMKINSQQQYRAQCNSENCDRKDPHPMSDHINVIIPGLLYLGDSVVANDRTWLVDHNIQAIVNVAEVDGVITNHEELEGRYLSFKVDDHFNAMQQIEHCFERAKEFLLQHHGQKTAVLVHCQQGVSRSSTLVIAYMMHLKKWSLRQALDVVQSARSKVAPNDGFMRALLQMEYALHGKHSMDEKDFPAPLELGYEPLRVHVPGGRENSNSHSNTSSPSEVRRNSFSGSRRGSESNIENVNLTIDRGSGYVTFGEETPTNVTVVTGNDSSMSPSSSPVWSTPNKQHNLAPLPVHKSSNDTSLSS